MILQNLCNVYTVNIWKRKLSGETQLYIFYPDSLHYNMNININLNVQNPVYFSTIEKFVLMNGNDRLWLTMLQFVILWKTISKLVEWKIIALLGLIWFSSQRMFNAVWANVIFHSSVFRYVWEGSLDDSSSNPSNKRLLKLKIYFSIRFQPFSLTHVLWARWCTLTYVAANIIYISISYI